MSKTHHARRPRRLTFYWRMRPRRTPRPQLPKRVAIAEQVAAMTEDLLDAPAAFAIPQGVDVYTDSYYGDQPLAPWERELLDGTDDHDEFRSFRLGLWYDDEEPDCETQEDEQDWSKPHPTDFTSAHCRECETCAYEYAVMYTIPYMEIDADDEAHAVAEAERALDAEDGTWDITYRPIMAWDAAIGTNWTYREAVAELGEGFIVTGPNTVRARPETKIQHYVRVYELARIAELPSHAVVALLRLQNEYVLNHLSLIARPAAREFLASINITGDLGALIESTRPLSIQERFARAIA